MDVTAVLSNRMYFTLLAEASPEAFIEFLENTEKDIYDVVFTPKKSNMGLTGWNIYYTEILLLLRCWHGMKTIFIEPVLYYCAFLHIRTKAIMLTSHQTRLRKFTASNGRRHLQNLRIGLKY